MANQEQQLDELFRQYRAAVPEVDASANFMPGVWARIEARRKAEQWLLRWVNVFACVATVLVIILAAALYQLPTPMPQRAYIEKLTDEISEDYFLDAAYVAVVQKPRGGR
jgi:hypothetical protein